MKIEALTCPQCAAALLNIAEDRDFYTCETCGAKLRVELAGKRVRRARRASRCSSAGASAKPSF